MEESSRPQVTITFGRSGQVVKRAGAVLDRDISDPVVGTKRSIRDRLGTAVDSVNKRSRGDDGRWNLKATNFVDDLHLSNDDLRFKIMKRTQTTVDLRDMLSRRARPSTTKPVAPQNLHEPRHGRQITSDIRDERRHIPEPRPRNIPEPRDPQNIHDQRDPRNIHEPRDQRQMPEPRNERPYMLEQRDDRRRILESRDDICRMDGPLEVRQHIPKLNDTTQRILEPTNGSMTSHFTSMRTSEAPSHMDFLRNSYSPWTLDHIRRKSPDLNTSRGLSPPPRRTEETQRRPIIRAYEAPKSVSYGGRDFSEIPRSMTTTSFITKPLSVGPMKSVGPLVTTRSTPLPSGGSMQRSQYPVAENFTVEGFLRSLGLEKYIISFKVEEVDMAALSQMGDHDLKDMGIPMGPRKKILLALLARARGQSR